LYNAFVVTQVSDISKYEDDVYPDLTNSLELLRWIDNIIDIVGKTTTTTSKRLMYNLVKFRLHHQYGAVLAYIIEREAFTLRMLQRHSKLSKNEVYPVVRFLKDSGLIETKSEIKNRTGPPSIIYLIGGAEEKKIFEAMQLHNDLKPTNAPLPFDYFKYKDEAEHIVGRILTFFTERRPHKQLYKETVQAYIREREDGYDRHLYKAVEKALGEQGWIVNT